MPELPGSTPRGTRVIGLLGGMSWESTAVYYRTLNEEVKRRLGGLHSARVVLWTLDMAELHRLQYAGEWDAAGALLVEGARSVERAGAECVLICANTMHRMAPVVEAAVSIPLLHIVDPTADALRDRGFTSVGLLGTRFTMEEPFYRDRLRERFGIETLVPEAADRAIVNRVIYEELCLGRFLPESRGAYVRIIESLAARGATAVILGCTEIALLVGPDDTPVPLFDTARLHAERAVTWALGDG